MFTLRLSKVKTRALRPPCLHMPLKQLKQLKLSSPSEDVPLPPWTQKACTSAHLILNCTQMFITNVNASSPCNRRVLTSHGHLQQGLSILLLKWHDTLQSLFQPISLCRLFVRLHLTALINGREFSRLREDLLWSTTLYHLLHSSRHMLANFPINSL